MSDDVKKLAEATLVLSGALAELRGGHWRANDKVMLQKALEALSPEEAEAAQRVGRRAALEVLPSIAKRR